ncbi:MAG: ABC transporter ATP-binding protein [Clostridia bacterium]|nr:ABC transporter ATP-binding protein [Clostridia bacterium]MBQ5809753.1 ABC transporter ATP-binding protein [Clostridia bacterium]
MAEKTKKQEKEKKKKLPFKRTVSNTVFALRQIWEASPVYFVGYYVMTFIYAPLDFLTGTYLIRMIVNGVEKNTPHEKIITYMLIVGAVQLTVNMISNYFWNVVNAGMYEQIGAKIQKKLFNKAQSVELACYENPAFYDKYVKAMDEAYNRTRKVMQTLDDLIWRLITLACNSFLLFFIDPWLIPFGVFPLLLGFLRRWINKLNHNIAVERKPIDRRIRYVRRTFYLGEYSKEMRMGNMYLRMLDELKATYYDFKAMLRRHALKRALAKYLQSIGLEVICVMGAMLYAVWSTVARGTMTVGDCIVILGSIGTISYCLSNAVQTFADFGEHSLFMEDVRNFLDYETKLTSPEGAPKAEKGDICFENVSFRYEGADSDTLKNVSLTLKQGEHIALVGQNGSGKTTLVKLLLRLYDVNEGKITLGGTDIREIDLDSYRESFSCVFQDFKIFSMSVEQNVFLRRRREGDRELAEYALKESGAYDKIATLEKGIDTTLTREFDENGANLSIGEQQKVSLARVFAEDTPFAVLDEPSSALDPIAEHKMFENMMRAAKGRSVVFISHRLSSAVDADRIYLMDGGTISECGTHAELMAQNGKYAEMFRLQAESYIGKEAAVQ